MEKQKVKIVSVGNCPKCQKEYVKAYPIDTAICQCDSITEVPLQLAFVVSRGYYVQLKNFANLSGVTVERLVEVLLDTYIDELYEKGLVNLVNLVKK